MLLIFLCFIKKCGLTPRKAVSLTKFDPGRTFWKFGSGSCQKRSWSATLCFALSSTFFFFRAYLHRKGEYCQAHCGDYSICGQIYEVSTKVLRGPLQPSRGQVLTNLPFFLLYFIRVHYLHLQPSWGQVLTNLPFFPLYLIHYLLTTYCSWRQVLTNLPFFLLYLIHYLLTT